MKYKRLKVAGVALVLLTGISIAGIWGDMETLAVTATSGIITIAMAFIGGDSYRPSGNDKRA